MGLDHSDRRSGVAGTDEEVCNEWTVFARVLCVNSLHRRHVGRRRFRNVSKFAPRQYRSRLQPDDLQRKDWCIQFECRSDLVDSWNDSGDWILHVPLSIVSRESAARSGRLLGPFSSFLILKIGSVGFGGGLAVIAQIRTLTVRKRHWLNEFAFAEGFVLPECEVLAMSAVTSEGDKSQKSSLNVVQAANQIYSKGAPRAGLIERVSDRFVH